MDKKFKKAAGHCPICGKGLAKSKKELLDKLGFDTTQKLALSAKDIKDAFKEKAKQLHPDKEGGSREKFQEIKEAKEELLEILEEEGSIDPLSIKPLDHVFGQQQPQPQTFQDAMKSVPDPIQMHHVRETVNKIRATRKHGDPCPYCKQH